MKPVVMEPLRSQWAAVEMEVDRILQLEAGKLEPTVGQRKNAEGEIRSFLMTLQSVRILDPACGSGNFLYVTLDLLKTLEMEVLQRWVDVTGSVQLSVLEQVKPSQFLGIEVNPRAAAIAELVIWIGYLQWHFKRFGNAEPPEPVLVAYGNIECRDAVLEWDRTERDVDKDGKIRSRWGGRLMRHPVTGEEVPDPTDQVEILRYVNPRAAVWPEADYIVSNPPFIGNARIREMLGDGYAETLRKMYKDVPDTVDFVMYWWHKAAEVVRSKRVTAFGFITTNSISQVRQRKLIDFHLKQKDSLRLNFAISDHPWADGDAAVRIAMTGATKDDFKTTNLARLGRVITEVQQNLPEDAAKFLQVQWDTVPAIFSDLKSRFDIATAKPLASNQKLSCPGMKLHGSGFCVSEKEAQNLEPEIIYPYLNGRDLLHTSRNVRVIDLFGLSEDEVQRKYPKTYQWIYDRVKPERDQNNRLSYRKYWWIFGEPRAKFRPALTGLQKYLTTVETAKHRTFTFLPQHVVPDNMLTVIALDDSYFLGIVSSDIHCIWALATGGDLGGNTPRYNKTICFDPFPFPDPTDAQKQTIRELGDRLDSHRKNVQANHPDITITGMYNLLEKLRKGEPFTDNDRDYNNKALVSTLKQIHDDLDRSVLEAYGWEDLNGEVGIEKVEEMILERLVTLNADRAAEERNGLIRWLRPEYQAPDTIIHAPALPGLLTEEPTIVLPTEQKTWSKNPKDQLTSLQDLFHTHPTEWTLAQIAAQFKNGTRNQKSIRDNLDRLEFFGIILHYQTDGLDRWSIALQ